MLVLELFGTLVLRTDNGPVPLAAQQKRRVGLLALLALGGRSGISRHRIEAYLWPESTADRARHALDQTVYAVRRVLGSDLIVAKGQELALNPERIRVDVWEFGDAIRAGEWFAASNVYTGNLLDGFHAGDSRELEAWIDGERARLLLDCQKAIESMADRSAAAGDHTEDLNWRRRLASSDPLSAGRAKKLIRALAASGDRASAVRQARQYQALVRRELEIEPDAEIEGLATAFSRAPASETPPPATPAPRAQPLGAPADATPSEPHEARPAVADMPIERRPSRPRITALSMAVAVATVVIIGLVATTGHGRGAASLTPPHEGARVPRPAAVEAYLAGIAAWDDRTKEGNDRAVAWFRRATEIDPEYAAAYAGLAEAYVRIGYFGYRPGDAMFPKAKAAALRSMQLDSTLAAAHTALATELIWEHDFAGAEAENLKAISLEPNNATAHQWYGVLLMILGRVQESVAEERRAAELEPLSLQIQNNYATFLNASGDHAGALRHFQRSIGEEPDSTWVRRNPWLLANMARVYADNGQYANAVQSMQRALRIVPNSPRALHTMAVIYDEMGRPDLGRQAFALADTSNEQYSAYRGMRYVSEGNPDSAFIWFDRQKSWGVQPMLSLQADRRIDPIRSDLRFLALLRRIGIPPRSVVLER
jgi:DNA-binding SARP family transcriptional activator/Tfp pilus assembly protein PilF